MLKHKIKQYGLEIEYPLHCSLDIFDYNIASKYHIHYDGSGVEFSTPKPLSRAAVILEGKTIYDIAEHMVTTEKAGIATNYRGESIFESNTAGIHIRIDVSNWNNIERLRFLRLFSAEMNSYSRSDYIAWMSKNFLRPWVNYNRPETYQTYRRCVDNNCGSEKFLNAKYEVGRYGRNVDTIEIRAFGVPEDFDKVIAMFDFIDTLCDIVDLSMENSLEMAIPDKLYSAWARLVRPNPTTTTETVDATPDNG